MQTVSFLAQEATTCALAKKLLRYSCVPLLAQNLNQEASYTQHTTKGKKNSSATSCRRSNAGALMVCSFSAGAVCKRSLTRRAKFLRGMSRNFGFACTIAMIVSASFGQHGGHRIATEMLKTQAFNQLLSCNLGAYLLKKGQPNPTRPIRSLPTLTAKTTRGLNSCA